MNDQFISLELKPTDLLYNVIVACIYQKYWIAGLKNSSVTLSSKIHFGDELLSVRIPTKRSTLIFFNINRNFFILSGKSKLYFRYLTGSTRPVSELTGLVDQGIDISFILKIFTFMYTHLFKHLVQKIPGRRKINNS